MDPFLEYSSLFTCWPISLCSYPDGSQPETCRRNSVSSISTLLWRSFSCLVNTVLYFRRHKLASPGQEGKSIAGSAELTPHRLTGTFLALSIFGHVGATRIAPLFLLDDPSEYDCSFITSMTEAIPGYVFHVYLVLLGMAGGWHLIYGTQSALAILSGSSVEGKPFSFFCPWIVTLELSSLSSFCQRSFMSSQK